MKNCSNAIRNIVNEFITNEAGMSEHPDILLSDDDFNKMMNLPSVQKILSNEDPSFEDGIRVGISMGFRMGLVNGTIWTFDAFTKKVFNESLKESHDVH